MAYAPEHWSHLPSPHPFLPAGDFFDELRWPSFQVIPSRLVRPRPVLSSGPCQSRVAGQPVHAHFPNTARFLTPTPRRDPKSPPQGPGQTQPEPPRFFLHWDKTPESARSRGPQISSFPYDPPACLRRRSRRRNRRRERSLLLPNDPPPDHTQRAPTPFQQQPCSPEAHSFSASRRKNKKGGNTNQSARRNQTAKMKSRPADQLVYEYMFPKPRQADPQNFHALLQRYLILEVRQETHSFYGHLDTPEAKYPGLDYTHPIHRIRLSRWPWHRRLFRAFDGLRLTHAEISGLTKWEGTKWAKERFEREQGIRIRDTTADGFLNYANPDDPYSAQSLRAESEEAEDLAATAGAEHEEENEGGDEEGGEESEGELESVGVALNERLRQRVEMRNISGDTSMPLDEEWENWLKHAIESGELPHVADQIARFPGSHSTLTADDIFPPRLVAAARADHWEEIPDFLHDMIRQTLQSGRGPAQTSTTASSSARPSVRYSSIFSLLNRDALYAADQQGDRSEVRPPESGGRHAARPGA